MFTNTFKSIPRSFCCLIFTGFYLFSFSAQAIELRAVKFEDLAGFSEVQKEMYQSYKAIVAPMHFAKLEATRQFLTDTIIVEQETSKLLSTIDHVAGAAIDTIGELPNVFSEESASALTQQLQTPSYKATMLSAVEEEYGDVAESILGTVLDLSQTIIECNGCYSNTPKGLSGWATSVGVGLDIGVLAGNGLILWRFNTDLNTISETFNSLMIAEMYIHWSIQSGKYLEINEVLIGLIENKLNNFHDTGRYWFMKRPLYDLSDTINLMNLYKGMAEAHTSYVNNISLKDISNQKSPPSKPQLSIASDSTLTSLTPIFLGGSFNGSNKGDVHKDTWWGILDSDTGVYVFDSGWSSSHKTQFQVPLSAGLVPGKRYTAAVAYRDQDGAHSPGGFASFETAPEYQVPEANFMRIPLNNYTHSSAPISSFFDHAQSNSVVRAFDGSEGRSSFGTFDDCYKQSSGQDFVFQNIRYVGDARKPQFLCYNGHQGVDFAVPAGTPVLAAADGYVIAKDNVEHSGGGCTVVINHGNGYATAYMHLECDNRIPLNSNVKQGDVIASSGATGNISVHDAHLHLEVRSNCPRDITAQCPGTSYPRVDPYGYLGENVLWADWSAPEVKEESDIKVSFIQPSSMDVRRNQLIKLFANVSNSGETETPATTLEFYASSDNGACGSGLKLGEVNVPPLNVNSSSTVSLYAISSDNWDNRRLTAVVGSFSGEDDLEDNCLIGPEISVSASVPTSNDFYLSSLSLDKTQAKAGEQVEIEYDVVYSGNGSEEEYVSSTIYLSEDAQLDDSDLYIGKELSTVGTEDESDGESKTITLPTSLESGQYYFLVVLDPEDDHGESSESNNLGVLAFTLEGTNDFSISEFSIDVNEIYEGKSLSVDVTTKYQGNNRSTQRPVTGIYISEDNVFDPLNDQLVRQIDTNLNANHVDDTDFSSETNENVSLRGVTPGNWYVFAVADHNDNYSESEESNNVSASLPLTVNAKGDFSLSNAPNTVSAPAGGEFNITLTSNYLGDRAEDTGSFIGCFISDDQEWDEFDVYTSIINETELNTHDRSEQIVMDIRLPSNLFPSTQYLICVTDFMNHHTEPNELDNAVSIELQIESGNDVYMANEVTTVDHMLYRGERFEARTVVSYLGESASSLIGKVGLYLSKDGIFSDDDSYIQDFSFSLDSSDLSDNVGDDELIIPLDIEPGEYYLLFVADHLNELTETNEFNNVAVSQKIGVEVQIDPDHVEPFSEKIIPEEETSRIGFGRHLDTSGDWLVSSAWTKDVNSVHQAGAVYVFKKDENGDYQQHQILGVSQPEAEDFLGSRGVAIDGDTILVGASQREKNNGSTRGILFVFRLIGDQWIETQTIQTPFDYFQNFGSDVTLDGNTGAVSDRAGYANSNQSTSERGSVYILNKNLSSDLWELGQKLNASDFDGFFGGEIVLNNDKLVVTNNSGEHYVFHKEEGTWLEKVKITNDHRNRGLVLKGDLMLLGYDLYEYDQTNEIWVKTTTLETTSSANETVEAAAISPDQKTIAISESGSNQIHVFQHINDTWGLTVIENAGIRSSSWYGNTISFSSNGDRIFVGDQKANVKAHESVGAIYVYENKLILDSDDDGINDDVDNCPETYNPNQLNSDDDLEGDICDIDDDNDSIIDILDCSKTDASLWQFIDGYLDIDNDGLGTGELLSVCSGAEIISDYTVSSEADNCPEIWNIDQLNTDGDRFGDECDEDQDNDGVLNDDDLDPLNPLICRSGDDGIDVRCKRGSFDELCFPVKPQGGSFSFVCL